MDITLTKNLYKEDKILFFLITIIFFIPISLILGNAAININVFLISIFTIIRLAKKGELKILISKDYLLILVFFISIFLTDVIALKKIDPNLFSLFRYYLIFVSVSYVFYQKKKLIFLFSKFIFIILIIFSIDIFIQYNLGKDVFGISSNSLHRFSGFMGTEWIAGSYISKFFLFTLIVFAHTKNFKLISPFLLAYFFFSVLITGERMASIDYLFISVLILCHFIYLKYFSLSKLIITILGLIIIFLTYYSTLNDNRKNIYKMDIMIKMKLGNIAQDFFDYNKYEKRVIEIESEKKNTHLDIFISSYEIIKQNYLFGTGYNNFYYTCKNFKNKKLYCENHSHNTYLNILSEKGVFVFIIFLYMIYFYIFKNSKIKDSKIEYQILLIMMIVLLNPISINGDFFATWTGSFFWYLFGIFYGVKRNENLQ